MKKIAHRPAGLPATPSKYCPGCLHATAHKLIAEVLEEMNLEGETIVVFPVGCSVYGPWCTTFDSTVAAHGRATAVATGIKRCKPDKLVISYQGDGDATSIGLAETIHSANRGENITVIFINNGIFGMTGGQMAPTTLVGQRSTTGGSARDPEQTGYPIKMCEMLAPLPATKYVARFSLNSVPNILKAKRGIKKAFQYQIDGVGYSFIELLSNCPTNWKMKPVDTLKHIEENVMAYYPLGEFKTTEVGK